MNYWKYEIFDVEQDCVIATEGFFETEQDAEYAAIKWIMQASETPGFRRYRISTSQHWADVNGPEEWGYRIVENSTKTVIAVRGQFATKEEAKSTAFNWIEEGGITCACRVETTNDWIHYKEEER